MTWFWAFIYIVTVACCWALFHVVDFAVHALRATVTR